MRIDDMKLVLQRGRHPGTELLDTSAVPLEPLYGTEPGGTTAKQLKMFQVRREEKHPLCVCR